MTERIASAPAEERPKSSDENAGLEGALQNATLLAASITLMKEENWERKFFCLLTSALMGDPFIFRPLHDPFKKAAPTMIPSSAS